MAVINPNIEILSNYINWNTKIKCRCKVCNSEVARLFVFGKEKVFGVKANKLRESIKELTLLDV